MTLEQYNLLSANSRIGIKPIYEPTEELKDSKPIPYYSLPIKRLTKASSFMILDEVFYIVKKDYLGKSSRLYHVYRVEDKRLVTLGVDKESTIKLVKDRYHEYS